ncbi:hypothetical protein D3C84_1200410 [compost metagenome]
MKPAKDAEQKADFDQIRDHRDFDPEEHLPFRCPVQMRGLVNLFRDSLDSGIEDGHVEPGEYPPRYDGDGDHGRPAFAKPYMLPAV